MEIEKTFICLIPLTKVLVKVYCGVVLVPTGITKMYFIETKDGIEEISELYFKSIKKVI